MDDLTEILQQAAEHGFRQLREDEPLKPGLVVASLRGETDLDEFCNERVTPPMSMGILGQVNHRTEDETVWDLTFPFNGAWVCPTERELRDPGQYLLFIEN